MASAQTGPHAHPSQRQRVTTRGTAYPYLTGKVNRRIWLSVQIFVRQVKEATARHTVVARERFQHAPSGRSAVHR